MKLNLLLTLAFPMAFFAQSTTVDSTSVDRTIGDYPNAFSSGSADVRTFDNSSRLFRDWSVSIGGGGAFQHNGDVNSFYDGKTDWGWNLYASLDKQITHVFGLGLHYQTGETNQKAMLPGDLGAAAGVATAYTKYHQLSLMGDINFSNLMRRVDNHSPYRWAMHGYAGVGFQGYNTLLLDNDMSRYSTNPPRIPIKIDQKLGLDTFMFHLGTGVKYNASKLIDIEARALYTITGDDSFDGGGHGKNARPPYNAINPGTSDNLLTVNLGLTFKLGGHDTHLSWYDPLQDINGRIGVLEAKPNEFIVCERGDADNDGVCDDWDRQLDTPAGARVDGAGVALDMDLDGVIDLYDKCVTVPGTVENSGCPK